MKQVIRALTKGAYDIQQNRIQIGNRLVANFKSKIGVVQSVKEDKANDDAKETIKKLRESFDRITDGVAAVTKRTKFKYDPLISNYTELCLVESYIVALLNEESHMRKLATIVEEHPLWDLFFKDVKGIGGTLAAIIISEFDIYKAKYVSSLWKYAGLDVVNGEGRSRKKDHLEEREYTDKDGEVKTKMGISFNPFLKTKLVGVAGTSFKRSGGKYRDIYDDYKHRISNMDRHADKSKGHIDNMAVRYAVKMMLLDLYPVWRKLEGLPVHAPYSETKLGHVHGSKP